MIDDITHIIFDLDGTLVKTELPYIGHMLTSTLSRFNIDHVTEDDMRQFWYLADRDSFLMSRFGVNTDSFWKEYQKHEDVVLRKQYTSAYEDVMALVELKKKGIRMSLLTAARLDVIEMELGLIQDLTGMPKELMFRPRVSVNFGYKIQTKEEGVEVCMELADASREETAFVGNGTEDIKAANENHILPIRINRGEFVYAQMPPHKLITTLNQLL